MSWNFLKYYISFVLLLAQFSVVAVDIYGEGGSSSLIRRRVPGNKFNQLLQVQEEIREINAEIHHKLDAILSSENAEERSFQALNLRQYLRYAYDEYKLSQKLDRIEDLARKENASTRLRLKALEILGEHSIPNTLIRSLLDFLAVTDENPKITKETKETLNKLKAAYSQTGRKFSDLLAYSHESDSVKEVIALLWVAIYEDERENSPRLLNWFSNDDPHRRQIGLLIFEEMKHRGGGMVGSRAVKNAVLRLRKEAKEAEEGGNIGGEEAATNSLALFSPSSFSDSEACGYYFVRPGPIVPRLH